MAARKEIEANNYSGSGLADYGVDDIFDLGNQDYGAKDMGSVYHFRDFKGKGHKASFLRIC